MELDLSSYFSASLGLMLLLVTVRVIMHYTALLSKFGIIGLYIFVILILLRGYLPFDFYKINLTTSYYSHSFLPLLQTIIFYEISIYGMSLSIQGIMILGLIIGCLFILVKKAYGYYTFRKYINSLPFCRNSRVIQICEEAFYNIFSAQRGYNIKIVQSNLFSSPAIFVSSYPIIMLPEISYTEEEWKFIFYHELMHLKHHDFFVKMAANLLAAVYWWNPVINKLLQHIINQVQELYVDYEVSKSLGKEEKVVYLKVLSKTAEHICKDKINKKYTYALSDNHSLNMLQRLECIINSKVNGMTYTGIIISIIIFIVSFTFIFEPSFQPTHDEVGDELFYGNEELSYYIWDGTNYKLYISGECVCTTPKIHEDFKDLPVYKEEFR